MADIYFWRQFLILCTGIFSSVTFAFMMTFPSVLNPAITSPYSPDIKTTADHASWITAMNGIGSLLGCSIMSPIMQTLGRKACYMTMVTFCFIGWTIFPFAADVTALYVARFIQGISTGSTYMPIFIVSEYVHPCRRGYFTTLKKVGTAVGVLCCHVLGAYLTWRHIAILAAMISLICILLTLFWPESPSHLALKGKFEECERAFIWLNGDSVESRKQLKSLVEAQMEKINRNIGNKNGFEALLRKFLKKDFQKPFLISTVLTLAIDLSGRHYYMAYLIQILTDLMDNQNSALYFTVGADVLAIIAASISTIVIRYVKRRTILLTSGASSVFLMLLISVLVYLKTVYPFPAPVLWFAALITILQSFIINIGVIPIALTVVSEIFPLEHKGFGTFVSCFIFTICYTAVLKLTPVLIEHTKLYGTFSMYALILAACMVVLYKTVPETKDKTLQEIEDELKDIRREDTAVMEREKLMN